MSTSSPTPRSTSTGCWPPRHDRPSSGLSRRQRAADPGPGSRDEDGMSDFELGAVLPIMAMDADRVCPTGPDALAQARRAEELGFDTIWVPDELLWQVDGEAPRGAGDGAPVAGG